MKTDLLDHGYIRMVSYTQPTGQKDFAPGYIADPGWTGDLEIVRAARVSYNADWRPGELATLDPNGPSISKDARLIHYLWSHHHTSPFEAMSFSFEVQAPIFVFRQWHRHRTQSYSEVSARYTALPDLCYIPAADQVRAQSKTNKQGRAEELPEVVVNEYRAMLTASCEESHRIYTEFLDAGVARELARLILPVNTYSRMYASANLLNWFRFLTLRTDPHAQYEIRVYALAILEMLATVCPVAVAAFRESIERKDDGA